MAQQHERGVHLSAGDVPPSFSQGFRQKDDKPNIATVIKSNPPRPVAEHDDEQVLSIPLKQGNEDM